MLKLQKSSLILILIIVVLTAGCVSIYTLGYTPGTVWHKAEDVKSGTFGQNVGKGNYNFPGNVGIGTTSSSSQLDVTGDIYATKQVTAGTKFKVGSSELSSSQLKVNGSSLVVTSTGNVGIGTTSPAYKLDVNGSINASGNIIAARPTTPEQLATKGYVDELIAQVEGIITGAQPLVNGAHTQQECINAGGEVVDSDVTFKQCRFNASACPSGWTQYKYFTTTQSVTGGAYGSYPDCTTGSHTWQNKPIIEYLCCGSQQIGTGYREYCCPSRSGTTLCGFVYAIITQVGCY